MRKETFLEAVDVFNKYLISQEKPRIPSKAKPFLRGMLSVYGFGATPISEVVHHHPIYSRTDLSNAQKNAIVFGSDFVRASKKLDDLVADGTSAMTVGEIKASKAFAAQIIKHYENIYNGN